MLGLKQGVLKKRLVLNAETNSRRLGVSKPRPCPGSGLSATNPQPGTVAPNPILGLMLRFPQGRLEQFDPEWALDLRSNTFLGLEFRCCFDFGQVPSLSVLVECLSILHRLVCITFPNWGARLQFDPNWALRWGPTCTLLGLGWRCCFD